MSFARYLVPVLALCCTAAAAATPLPPRLDVSAPFPRITSQAPVIEPVAPGVTQAEYDLQTQGGPIVVRVVAVEPGRSDVRLNAVLADDALTSRGETVSSMARRTGAVAGINADYFDIGATNRPTNIVVRDGRLLRSPRKRYALVITKDGQPHIVENAFTGQVVVGTNTVSLDAINEIPPPNGGVSLLTPEYGPVAASDNLTLVAMTPAAGGTPPFASYRVSAIADNLTTQPAGYYLAIGLNSYGTAGVPNPGDTIVATGDLTPLGPDRIAAAVGGGPMILQNGAWVDDADGPNGGEYAMRIPSSGAAVEPDGTLLLIEVDGRQPEYSIGVTRPEFAALMHALGGTDGLAFDGGGSSEIAARELGTPAATLRNTPSDGRERRVADGIFVYSDAADGPANEIVARPSAVRALAGTEVPLDVVAIDASDRPAAMPGALTTTVEPASLGAVHDGVFSARNSGTGAILFRSGEIRGRVPVEISDDPARIAIVPERANVAQNGRIQMSVRAFDAKGYPLALPPALRWAAADARISPQGMLDAGTRNARVTVAVGRITAGAVVTVGSHDVALAFAQRAHFMSVPKDGDGGVTPGPGELTLQYALGPAERAAYAAADVALPPNTVGIAFDVRDDGSGARVRVAVRNAINEQILATALTLDHPGWRHAVVRLPQNLAEPAKLSAIYVIDAASSQPLSGSIGIRNVTALVAGSP